jgi:putative molybdopterin biosynthesis protein
MRRNIYLEKKSLAEARERFLAAFSWVELVGTEVTNTVDALGRVTARPVFSRFSAPGYAGAAMDGFAVLARETFSATEEQPVQLHVDDQAFGVNTGQPLPQGTDAVVMIEQVHQVDPQTIEIRAPAFPWQHVRRVGEDMVARELVLPHHHALAAADVAALLQAGVFRLEVLRRPRVAILPTGTELLDWWEAEEAPPAPGAIIETNSIFLSGLVREAGGEPVVLPRQPDRLEPIQEAVAEALDRQDIHMVLINAGASAGTKDFTSHVVSGLGEVLVHGLMVMPGKPTLLGAARGKPVVGTPGYPVSAWVCFDQLVGPALSLMRGQVPVERPTVVAVPARRLASRLGQEEFLRVHLGRVGQRVVATPLKRGAGTITSLTRADGILRIPAQSEGLDENDETPVELLRPPSALERTLVIVGSHDMTLDHLADHMRRRAPQIHVSASNLGSMAGLVAVGAGRCHLAGTHLLDPDTGEYNIRYVKKLLPHVPVELVTLALREQGFIVKPGNPKGIRDFGDLASPGLRFINRQAGSGTRVLLDYHIRNRGISIESIEGYDQEEFTHMAVAVQVLTGGADVGLGILAAARALDLDFIPVCSERYDLCIPLDHIDDFRVRTLLETLDTPEFRKLLESLGGYDVAPTGERARWVPE